MLKEVDLPVLTHFDCERKLKETRLGSDFVLHPGFLCAGGEEGKDACKGEIHILFQDLYFYIFPSQVTEAAPWCARWEGCGSWRG